MGDDPFIKDFSPEIGVAVALAPGLRRIVAPNASAMTFRGTNTYLLGETEIAVIDPGPADPRHLAAILSAVGPAHRISHIFVTHSHLDHSPLAGPLAKASGAPILALGDSWTGRSDLMTRLAASRNLGGGEGVDDGFDPDQRLADGQTIATREWTIDAITTPGHFSNHMCFAWREQQAVFSGDHVMSWATTLVSPPDGDLSAFMRSLDKMAARQGDGCYYPGHGAALVDPHPMVRHQIRHRRHRESQILSALETGPATPLDLAWKIYTDIPSAMIPLATRNVFAHLIDLVERNFAKAEVELSPDAKFSLKSRPT